MALRQKRVIEKDMAVRDVLRRYPETLAVFQGHGLTCAVCAAALSESIAQAAVVHGVAVDVLIKDLNEVLSG